MSERIFSASFITLMNLPISRGRIICESRALRHQRRTSWLRSNRRTTDCDLMMELTITQNGALYALQHGATEKNSLSGKPRTETSYRADLMLADKSRAASKRLILRLPLERINWTTSSFLIVTLGLTLT